MGNERDLKLKGFSDALRNAEKTCVAIGPISKADETLTIPEAYKIQLFNIDEKVKEGQKITGKKIGLTSPAMQNMLNVNQPDFGHLLDSMEVQNNTIEMSTMLQPKVEGEVAFILKKDLVGPNVTVADVLEATDYCVAAIEIVGSRVKDWKINIIDTVADNASSGMYVLGDTKVDPKVVDLTKTTMVLYKNGEMVNEGKGTDVMGDPSFCVAWLANKMGEYGVQLKAGDVILSGAFSAAPSVAAGEEWKAVFSDLGEAVVKFV